MAAPRQPLARGRAAEDCGLGARGHSGGRGWSSGATCTVLHMHASADKQRAMQVARPQRKAGLLKRLLAIWSSLVLGMRSSTRAASSLTAGLRLCRAPARYEMMPPSEALKLPPRPPVSMPSPACAACEGSSWTTAEAMCPMREATATWAVVCSKMCKLVARGEECDGAVECALHLRVRW